MLYPSALPSCGTEPQSSSAAADSYPYLKGVLFILNLCFNDGVSSNKVVYIPRLFICPMTDWALVFRTNSDTNLSFANRIIVIKKSRGIKKSGSDSLPDSMC
jgi:hypothetical protein